MTSAAGVWIATKDEVGQPCWINSVTRRRTYHIEDRFEPLQTSLSTPTPVVSTFASPVLAPASPMLAPVIPMLAPVSPMLAPVSPMLPPMTRGAQSMPPYTMQSPNNAAYGVGCIYPGGGNSGAFPPPSPTGTSGMGTTEYPCGSITWF